VDLVVDDSEEETPRLGKTKVLLRHGNVTLRGPSLPRHRSRSAVAMLVNIG